jgi:hypothetical protein
MVVIPEQFLMWEQVKTREIARHLWAGLITETVKDPKTLTPEQKQAREAALKQSYDEDPLEPSKHFDEWLSRAMDQKPHFIEVLHLAKPYQSLLYSGLMWAWISFEVLAKDLWEATVNAATGKVRASILKSCGARPSVSIDSLAKYDYDVRGYLGTIMKDNFVFTSLAGIQKAYAVLLPRSQGVTAALHRTDLGELEASRHLIAHQSGMVDDEYIRRTKSNLKKGDELPITYKEVLDYCSTTVEVAVILLTSAQSVIRRESSG